MKAINFNNDWSYSHLGKNDWKNVTLPHDAQIFEERQKDAPSGVNGCWFLGFDYEYKKTFSLPKEYQEKNLTLEFEGIYHNAEIYFNNELLASRPYGYTNIYVDITDKIKEQNEIRVIAKNSDQPNSRWYSGAGIYRPVTLFVQEKKHIKINGLKVRTLQINPAILEISCETSENGNVEICIEKANIKKIIESNKKYQIEISNAKVWSPNEPNLYTITANFENESQSVEFGIRKVEVTAQKGFCLNGKRELILGACIHHDNGILGARTYKEAEYRKVKLLKQAGYNAIRSAHNPCSKYLLEACDKLGMMIMDEYVDMWYIHKTKYDYANYAQKWYEKDIFDMIEKDYNHPSVVMYSLGNEVAETAQPKGIEFYKSMQAVCKKYDPDRPVTTGVNIFFNLLHSMGFGVYSDKKADEEPNKKVGSEFFNDLAGKLGAGFMKTMATLHACDIKTRDCYSAMDVAGYNYGILRYKKDIKKYPNRIILGSETFCSDAYTFYEFAKSHPQIIGDYVWAGIDYLGEVGVGAWEYKDYAPDFSHGVGWMTAGSGRIDLCGNFLGEALYTQVAFEKIKGPQIAVVPVKYTKEKHSPSAWKFSGALPSWSWNGCDGQKAKVEVYSRAPQVELLVNGKSVAKKKFRKNCKYDFNVTYHDGEICAIERNNNGTEIARNTLRTAENETIISIIPETSIVDNKIKFVKIAFTDKNGCVKPLEKDDVTLNIEGGELLAFGNACPFNLNGYNSNTTFTYYGEALAVIKGDGQIKITATSKNLTTTKII